MAKVLVTGGAGYIGAHCCVSLIEAGFEPVLFDNLGNSSRIVVDRLERITGRRPTLVEADIRDAAALDACFAANDFAAVIHFAALKAVGESVAKPLEYFDNNVSGTLRLLAAMRRANVRTLVFSSSATVYGDPQAVPAGVRSSRSRSQRKMTGVTIRIWTRLDSMPPTTGAARGRMISTPVL